MTASFIDHRSKAEVVRSRDEQLARKEKAAADVLRQTKAQHQAQGHIMRLTQLSKEAEDEHKQMRDAAAAREQQTESMNKLKAQMEGFHNSLSEIRQREDPLARQVSAAQGAAEEDAKQWESKVEAIRAEE